MGVLAAALVSLTLGNWQVAFDETDAKLEFAHRLGEARATGTLAFSSGGKPWRVVAPRDAVQRRLALLDPSGDVQGYVTFQEDGDRLSLLVSHRTAQAFEGRLTFSGEVAFTPDSFACRTQPAKGGRVIQFASGPADTALNDSLFDPERDLGLLIRAASARLTTKGGGRFGLELGGTIHEAAEAAWTFSLERDYYRTRYAPYYQPINRARCPSPPTGWMSWNTYFDTATADDNLAEARFAQKHLQPFGLTFWHIESWQDNSDTQPVRTFDNLSLTPSPRKFPDGMKKLADDIRALGFRPGLWTAPFGTGSTNFYLAHKSWFLHDPAGKPMGTWNGLFTIDPSQPEVIDHLREIHRVASREWGYEFFKIDGMSGRNRSYSAHFFERPEVRAAFKDPACPDPFARCVRAFREGIGDDRVFLACQGHFTGPEATYADAARTGADIVHPGQPPKWPNLLNQAQCTLNQIFMNNIVFFSDPDTLLVGDALGIEQARLAATVVALPGQMMFAGDKLPRLAPERLRLLQQALPVCDVRPLDLFPVFDWLPVWALHVRRPFAEWQVVALFNWAEDAAEVGFSFQELGLDEAAEYALHEFWTDTDQGVRKGRFDMQVPGHGVRLLAVHRAQAVPQFISSDRHLTQGAVELTRLGWNAQNAALEGAVKVVGGYPLTLRFRVPRGFAFGGAQADGDASCAAVSESAGRVAITLTGPRSQEVPFTLRFSADGAR
ncbi:MAG: alpha-galactosidase [Verrucomicrobiota bacterium]|jgi:hypothetical protein|nr:alpha-galactosidase [Verrucomicrobiota bacterium]